MSGGNMTMIRTRWAAIGAAVAVTIGGGGFFVANAAETSDDALYHPVTPVRVMDTRVGGTAVTGTVKLKVEGTIATYNANGSTTQVEVVPSSASAVAINLTVTAGQKNGDYGYVTAFPCTATTDAVPTASSLNFSNSVDIANALNVSTSSTGELCLYVYGTAHLIVDVAGYFDESRIAAIAADYLDNDADITMSYSANSSLKIYPSGFIIPDPRYVYLDDVVGELVIPIDYPYQISTSGNFGRYRLSSFKVCLPPSAFINGGNISNAGIYDGSGVLYDSGPLTAASWTADSCRTFTLTGDALPTYGSSFYNLVLLIEDTNAGTANAVKIESFSATFSPIPSLVGIIPPILLP